MIREFNIPRSKYYKKALSLLNHFIGLTDYEIEIIATMLYLNIKILTKEARVLVRSKLESSEASFNNYIKKLKDKKALVDTDEGLIVSSGIVDALSDNQIHIKFNIDENS